MKGILGMTRGRRGAGVLGSEFWVAGSIHPGGSAWEPAHHMSTKAAVGRVSPRDYGRDISRPYELRTDGLAGEGREFRVLEIRGHLAGREVRPEFWVLRSECGVLRCELRVGQRGDGFWVLSSECGVLGCGFAGTAGVWEWRLGGLRGGPILRPPHLIRERVQDLHCLLSRRVCRFACGLEFIRMSIVSWCDKLASRVRIDGWGSCVLRANWVEVPVGCDRPRRNGCQQGRRHHSRCKGCGSASPRPWVHSYARHGTHVSAQQSFRWGIEHIGSSHLLPGGVDPWAAKWRCLVA